MIVSLIAGIILWGNKPSASRSLSPLNLIPTPQHVTRNRGYFRIGPSTNIVFSDQYPDDRFAAEQLMEEVLTDIGERIQPSSTSSDRAISLERLKEPIADSDQGQGYRLEVTPLKVTVSANSSDGLFYGVQTLKQLIRANRKKNSIPACRIIDWPALKYRGWQDDISRGPIPTYGFLMKEIRTLSEFKLNMLTLYTEHVFKLKKNPAIAPSDGITAEEIADLSSYARQYHVEVVGNFQSFGHFRNILKVPGYEKLAENASVLSPAKEESYKFLESVYSEIAPAYTSKLFNINCDEVSGLGQGPSKDLVKELGVGGLYARHINRVSELLHKFGKTPMMWGDIALNYPDIVSKLPKDLIVLPWAYDGRSNFDNQILPFTKFGLQFMVCPGVSCWSQIWPDLDNATINISNFIRDGAKFGALGSLNTAWDDDGLNFFNDNWYQFVWGAECSWKPALLNKKLDPDATRSERLDRFNKQFPAVFFGLDDPSLSDTFLKLSAERKNPVTGGMRNAVLWRDPVATLGKLQNPDAIQSFLDEVLAMSYALRQARSQATHNAPALDYAIFASQEEKYLGESLLTARAIIAGNRSHVKDLAQEVIELRDSYIELWQRENRTWWLDKNIAKFDDLTQRIEKL